MQFNELNQNYDNFIALNQSFAWKLLTNVKSIKYPKKEPDEEENEKYDAFFIGKAFHFYVLICKSDEEFLSEYAVTDMRFGTKKFEEFSETAKLLGKQFILKEKDWTAFKIMKYELLLNKHFITIYNNFLKTEAELYREMPDCVIKGRLDVITTTSHLCCDIKTIKSDVLGNEFKLKYHIKEYGYHLQALFYNYLLGIFDIKDMKYLLFFVEKTAPYNVQVVQLSTELLIEAEMLYKEAVKRWNQYLKSEMNAEQVEGYHLPSLII